MKKTWLLVLISLLLIILLSASAAEEAAFAPKDLPVISLTIDGGQEEIDRMNNSEDHSYKCTGVMDILIPEGYSGDFESRYPQQTVTGLKMKYIRGRGNGTWGMAKHPYKIKLEEKQNLFGMGANKTWILLSNFFDNSLIRNRLTEWLGEQMCLEYTPQGVFVEVVMNGEYLGSYYLCEKVQIGKARVAIDELKENDQDLPTIQGGYLLAFSPDDWDSPSSFETKHGQLFGNQDPSFDPGNDGWRNDAQMNYIRDYIQQAEDAVWAENGLSEEGRSYSDYIDLQSLADIWWINEFTVNEDAFRTDSAHLYKKRTEPDGSEGKLYFGPLWDFDESWGNAQVNTTQNIGFNNATFIWIDELRKKPEFLEYLKERWQVMDAKLEEIVREGGVLDQTAALVKDSWERDHQKWQADIRENNLDSGRNFQEEMDHLRRWITLRRDWINQNLDRLGLLTFALSVQGDGMEAKEYRIACDTTVDLNDLEIPEVEGRSFTGWFLEDGTPAEDFLVMTKDITLTARFSEE